MNEMLNVILHLPKPFNSFHKLLLPSVGRKNKVLNSKSFKIIILTSATGHDHAIVNQTVDFNKWVTDNMHGFNLSLKGPVDISMYSRVLFIKKAKCLKSWSIILIASLEEQKNPNLRGNTWASSQICARRLYSFRQLSFQVFSYFPAQWHPNVCCATWQEDEGKLCVCNHGEHGIPICKWF